MFCPYWPRAFVLLCWACLLSPWFYLPDPSRQTTRRSSSEKPSLTSSLNLCSQKTLYSQHWGNYLVLLVLGLIQGLPGPLFFPHTGPCAQLALSGDLRIGFEGEHVLAGAQPPERPSYSLECSPALRRMGLEHGRSCTLLWGV